MYKLVINKSFRMVFSIFIFLCLFHGTLSEENKTHLCPEHCDCLYNDLKVSCAGRELNTIPTTLERDITVLSVSGATIPRIENTSFAEYPSIRYLRLSNSQVSHVDSTAFAHFEFLVLLDLSSNRIRKIDATIVKFNPHIQTLSLRNNPLDISESDTLFLENVPSLTNLNLAYCNIKYIPNSFFKGTLNLKTLDLTGNSLNVLNVNAVNFLSNLQLLRIARNPWTCDCEVRPFQEWYSETFNDNETELIRCSQPESFRRLLWSEILESPCIKRVTYENNFTWPPPSSSSAASYGWGIFVGLLVGSLLLLVLFNVCYFLRKHTDVISKYAPWLRHRRYTKGTNNPQAFNNISMQQTEPPLFCENNHEYSQACVKDVLAMSMTKTTDEM